MASTPEEWAEAAKPFLTDEEALRVFAAIRKHPRRAAVLISAILGGRTVNGQEIAKGFLEVAGRLEREGGMAS